jgi:hypothetical protein
VALEVAYINLRVDGMSRHINVGVTGVVRSINGVCTCVRAWQNEKLENRIIGVWIREAHLSPWPEGELGTVSRGGETDIYLPPDAFDHAWKTALAPTNKQLNLTVPVGSDSAHQDGLAVIGFSFDELLPSKPEQKSSFPDYSNVILTAIQILLVLYACYEAAKYFKIV